MVTALSYSPEADFIVQSARRPANVMDYDTFVKRRAAFEQVKSIAYPKRNGAQFAVALQFQHNGEQTVSTVHGTNNRPRTTTYAGRRDGTAASAWYALPRRTRYRRG